MTGQRANVVERVPDFTGRRASAHRLPPSTAFARPARDMRGEGVVESANSEPCPAARAGTQNAMTPPGSEEPHVGVLPTSPVLRQLEPTSSLPFLPA